MTNITTFKVPGRRSFTGVMMEIDNYPYPQYYVRVKESGRNYLKKPNYIQRKRIHKYVEDHQLVGCE